MLVEYELIHTNLWNKKITDVEKSLNSTLLVRDPDTQTIYVNYDPQIQELMREIDVMGQLGIDVPLKAREMRQKRDQLKEKYDSLKVSHIHNYFFYYTFIFQLMLEENESIRAQIPDLLFNLMQPHLEMMDETLSPGLTLLRWTSLNIDSYIDSVRISLKELETLIGRAKDILDVRIEGGLNSIKQTVLCELPEGEQWTPQQFMDKVNVSCVYYACMSVGTINDFS